MGNLSADLYAQVIDLFLAAHTPAGASQTLTFVETHWVDLRLEKSPESAEICRLAMLAALQCGNIDASKVWRARALARFTAVGWVEGVGALIIGDAFAHLARANDDYPQGTTLDVLEPSPAAIEILREVEPFTVGEGTSITLGPSAPSRAVLRRLYHEKLGFLLLLSQQFDAASAAYAGALDAAGDHKRGAVKVRLGQLLVDYLRPGGREKAGSIAEQTAALAYEAEAALSPDVAEAARANAAVMRAGSRAVSAYEIL